MQLNFTRGDEIAREQRAIPAELYNKIRLLYSRVAGQSLFVPIRSMQYLAVIDDEEIIFVDGQRPRAIEISWQDFHSGQRGDLRDPVNYTCIHYHEKGPEIMGRLQSEFLKALQLIEARQPKSESASVTPLERSDR